MKRIFPFILSLSLLIASCGPSRYAVQVEMRHPSKSGLELTGKNLSVVYLTDGDSIADKFDASMADGFAYALEKDYGTGDGSIGIYSLEDKGGKYSDKDTLVNLLMDTGADVVFLFGKTDLSKVNDQMTKYTLRLYCFDAMNKDENVYTFAGSSIAEGTEDKIAESAWEVGNTVAGSFKSQWKHEQYSIIYYDSQKWYDALDKAEAYEWKAAMDIWIGLLDTPNIMKRSCAEYNIAVACYMLGDYALAEEWLDRSEQDNELPVTDALRKRIMTRKSAH